MLEQGGIQPGGLNFDCKVRRESTNVNDMFIAHIGKFRLVHATLHNIAFLILNYTHFLQPYVNACVSVQVLWTHSREA